LLCYAQTRIGISSVLNELQISYDPAHGIYDQAHAVYAQTHGFENDMLSCKYL